MRLNFDMSMLNRMNEPVMLLDRHARCIGSNRAAQDWLPAHKVAEPTLKRWIDEEIQGQTRLPVAIDSFWGKGLAQVPRYQNAWLCKNGPKEYAILIEPLGASARRTTAEPKRTDGDQNFVRLMAGPAQHLLERLHYLLEEQNGGALGGAHLQQLLRHTAMAGRMLHDITGLCELLDRDEVFSDERLNVHSLVMETLQGDKLRGVAAHIIPANDPGITVYGARPWLRYALTTLFEAVLAHAPADNDLQVSIRQLGDFVVVRGGITLSRDPSARSNLPRPTQHSRALVDPFASQVSMVLCRRIVALHGAQLKLESMDFGHPEDGSTSVESFTLTLMTGAPVNERSRTSCAQCRHVLQEQAYAQDLAHLISHN